MSSTMKRRPTEDDFAATMGAIICVCAFAILLLICYIAWRILT
jgi:hypothetical protein